MSTTTVQDRLSLKTPEAAFLHVLQAEFDFSPRVSRELLATAKDLLLGSLPSLAVRPGQVRLVACRLSAPFGPPLTTTDPREAAGSRTRLEQGGKPTGHRAVGSKGQATGAWTRREQGTSRRVMDPAGARDKPTSHGPGGSKGQATGAWTRREQEASWQVTGPAGARHKPTGNGPVGSKGQADGSQGRREQRSKSQGHRASGSKGQADGSWSRWEQGTSSKTKTRSRQENGFLTSTSLAKVLNLRKA